MESISARVISIFAALSISLYVLEVALSIDFGGSWLVILLQLDLFAVLIGWHIGVGVIAPLIRESVWTTETSYDQPDNEQSHGFFSFWLRIAFPLLVAVEVCILIKLLGHPAVVDYIILFLYIVFPTVLLLKRHWMTLFLSVLWTWFPIEYGIIDQTLGELSMELIPLDALLGIFSLLWPLLTCGRHISWYSWELTKYDFLITIKVSGWLTLAIVPFGILLRFITINPDNIVHPEITVSDIPVLNSMVYAIVIFYLIFVVQGLMEETLFRDVIFKHQYYWLEERKNIRFFNNFDLGHIVIILGGLLICSIPTWDNILNWLVDYFPDLTPIADQVGNMALPLGEYEGREITMISNLPLWPFYLLVGVLLIVISLFVYSRHHTPMIAALLLSSMIFGFAHFQDFRYVFFASIAGFGYGYTYYKTKNLVPAAMVHMGVDAIWVLFLTY